MNSELERETNEAQFVEPASAPGPSGGPQGSAGLTGGHGSLTGADELDRDGSDDDEPDPSTIGLDRGADSVAPAGELVRLQKVLAAAGVGSRRASEQLIAAGRVRVDGQVVDQLGARVDPERAQVTVDGRIVIVRAGAVYLALNKPKGVLSAMSDDRGRPTVGDLVRDRPERLFHVGRLDADSEGLLLLTNDGQLANQLMHPSRGVPKTYLADVAGEMSRATTRQLLAGIELDDGPIRVDAIRVVSSFEGRSLVEVVLHEGRNRIVRRLLAAVGHPVSRLVRTAIGPLLLGSQRAGVIRSLSQDEVSSLYSYMDKPTKP